MGRGAAAVGRRGGLRVPARGRAPVRTLPELKEISTFFTAELTAQLADARSATTSKLDAPVNKLARLLNSPSIKRVLLNDSLRVDFDRVIAGGEVLDRQGRARRDGRRQHLGADAAAGRHARRRARPPAGPRPGARAHGRRAEGRRGAAGPEPRLRRDDGAEALGRAGDGRLLADRRAVDRPRGARPARCAVRPPRVLRDGLDSRRARRGRADDGGVLRHRAPRHRRLSALGAPRRAPAPPKHHAIASWTTPAGRASAFVAETMPMRVDRTRIAEHAAEQAARGARRLADLRQPHWEGAAPPSPGPAAPPAGARPRATVLRRSPRRRCPRRRCPRPATASCSTSTAPARRGGCRAPGRRSRWSPTRRTSRS